MTDSRIVFHAPKTWLEARILMSIMSDVYIVYQLQKNLA